MTRLGHTHRYTARKTDQSNQSDSPDEFSGMQARPTLTVDQAQLSRAEEVAVDLVADGGSAAASPDDFFRCPEYLRTEGVTHSLWLRSASASAAVPLIVRPIPGTGLRDAISPYGYPGAQTHGAPLALGSADLSGLGLVSMFVRDRALLPSLAGGTGKGRLHLHDPAVERRLSKSFRRDVRRCQEAGYGVAVRRGRDVDDELAEEFHEVYLQTMRRRGAAPGFHHSLGYLSTCLRAASAWLVYAPAPCGRLSAGDLIVASDGVLHSLLFGTGDDFLPMSPGKLATMGGIELADELGLPFNVGGGLSCGDGLEMSKRSYCNRGAEFICHEIVGDPRTYNVLLSSSTDGSDFFPRYRSG